MGSVLKIVYEVCSSFHLMTSTISHLFLCAPKIFLLYLVRTVASWSLLRHAVVDRQVLHVLC